MNVHGAENSAAGVFPCPPVRPAIPYVPADTEGGPCHMSTGHLLSGWDVEGYTRLTIAATLILISLLNSKLQNHHLKKSVRELKTEIDLNKLISRKC